jgi:hypothetical protein
MFTFILEEAQPIARQEHEVQRRQTAGPARTNRRRRRYFRASSVVAS